MDKLSTRTSGINRDIIKYLAMLTMFLNHFAHVLLTPGTVLYEAFLDIGYFTAITMCYFLVEGYGYTHSRKKYAQRLLLFAVISQIPYTLVFGFYQLNMLFTLLLCFLILVLLEKESMGKWRYALIVLIVVFSIFSDWAIMAPLFTIMFAVWKNDKKKQVIAYAIAILIFGFFNYPSYMMTYGSGKALLYTCFSVMGIVVSGIFILCLYNGQRAVWGRKFSKWFFYIFYPAHITLLGLIKMFM